MNQLSKRQKIIVSIYLIVGIMALPLACVYILMKRYIVEDKEAFNPENRGALIIEFSSFMVACTVFAGLILLLVHFIRP